MGITYNAYKCMLCGQYKDTYQDINNHYANDHQALSPNMPDVKNAHKCHKCSTYKDYDCDIIKHYRQSH